MLGHAAQKQRLHACAQLLEYELRGNKQQRTDKVQATLDRRAEVREEGRDATLNAAENLESKLAVVSVEQPSSSSAAEAESAGSAAAAAAAAGGPSSGSSPIILSEPYIAKMKVSDLKAALLARGVASSNKLKADLAAELKALEQRRAARA